MPLVSQDRAGLTRLVQSADKELVGGETIVDVGHSREVRSYRRIVTAIPRIDISHQCRLAIDARRRSCVTDHHKVLIPPKAYLCLGFRVPVLHYISESASIQLDNLLLNVHSL